MKTTAERAAALGSIHGFDSNALRAGDGVSQELCDLILAFALIFNDCRDILLWHEETQGEAPKAQALNRLSGEYGGTITHTFRLLAAVLHELGELVQKNSQVLNDPFFRDKVLPKLDKDARERWERLEALARGKKAEKPLDDLLYYLRNKSVYHYDAPDLRPAYDRKFPPGSSERAEQPLVSVGNTVRGTRWYFADAVAYDLLESEAATRGLAPLGPKLSKALTDLVVTLARIVEAFLQARTPWTEFRED